MTLFKCLIWKQCCTTKLTAAVFNNHSNNFLQNPFTERTVNLHIQTVKLQQSKISEVNVTFQKLT
jgi:hypothetical protein